MTVLMKAIIRIQIYFQLIICLFDLLKHNQTNKQSNENKSCTDQKLNVTCVVAIILMLNDIFSVRCYMKIRCKASECFLCDNVCQ
jgi:hypothetical protein